MHDVIYEARNELGEKVFMETEIGKLIRQSQLGEHSALEELLRIYESLILNISKRYYFKDGEADDVIQECNIAFFDSVLAYDLKTHPISLESFAYICITRRMSTCLRKRSALNTKIHIDAMEFGFRRGTNSSKNNLDVVSSERNTEKEYLFKETKKEYLEEINDHVSAECFEILDLRVQGFSYKEIEEKLGISKKKIDNSLYKIRKNLDLKEKFWPDN